MGTLYRRYGSKAELLQHLCVLAMEQALEAAEEALKADDPWAGLAGYITACVELRSGALASLAGQIETTAEMRRTAQRGMARATEIIARAHRNGSLRPDATAMDISQPPRPGPSRPRRGTQRPLRAGSHRPRRPAAPHRRHTR
jgi:AcrR family transcriptional regulator